MLREVVVEPVEPDDEGRFRTLLDRHHWQDHFGHPVWLLETFVDPQRFHGTVYRAANWLLLGQTQGYRRIRGGYSSLPFSPKLVFVYPLIPDCRARLTARFGCRSERQGDRRVYFPPKPSE